MAITLLDLLSNEYLLLATTPYLLPTELLSLSQTSHSFHSLLTHSRSVWRHLNLSTSNLRDPEPLLITRQVLRDTKTLVLDKLPVTVELLHSLLTASTHRIQLLSLRECPAINERQLLLLLQYLVRPSRPADQPSLKGLYYFTAPDGDDVVSCRRGRFIKPSKLTSDWAGIVKACEGAIAFDTRLCRGPRHNLGAAEPKLGSIRLIGRCSGCGIPPEKRKLEDTPATLIPPVPITSSSLRAACHNIERNEEDVIRCNDCVKNRWCERCGKWWCEECQRDDDAQKRVSLDCYDCGALCAECAVETARSCTYCSGGYCIVHDVNATEIRCEWCTSVERRNRMSDVGSSARNRLVMTRPEMGRMVVKVVANARHFQDEVINRNRCLVTS